jgi:RNA polymerase sigma-70 factor (ECF subfamily)
VNTIPPQYPQSFTAYLEKITRNVALNILKKQKTQLRYSGEISLVYVELAECIPSGSNVEQESESNTLTQMIYCFLLSTQKDHRNVFIRRYRYADSIDAMASRYPMSQSKAKSMLFRTWNKLRLYFEKEGISI